MEQATRNWCSHVQSNVQVALLGNYMMRIEWLRARWSCDRFILSCPPLSCVEHIARTWRLAICTLIILVVHIFNKQVTWTHCFNLLTLSHFANLWFRHWKFCNMISCLNFFVQVVYMPKHCPAYGLHPCWKWRFDLGCRLRYTLTYNHYCQNKFKVSLIRPICRFWVICIGFNSPWHSLLVNLLVTIISGKFVCLPSPVSLLQCGFENDSTN